MYKKRAAPDDRSQPQPAPSKTMRSATAAAHPAAAAAPRLAAAARAAAGRNGPKLRAAPPVAPALARTRAGVGDVASLWRHRPLLGVGWGAACSAPTVVATPTSPKRPTMAGMIWRGRSQIWRYPYDHPSGDEDFGGNQWLLGIMDDGTIIAAQRSITQTPGGGTPVHKQEHSRTVDVSPGVFIFLAFL